MDVQIWTSEGSLAQEELRRAKARQRLSGGGQRWGQAEAAIVPRQDRAVFRARSRQARPELAPRLW